MANITRWEPFRDLMSFRSAMDRLFDDTMGRPFGLYTTMGSPSVDMYQTRDNVVVKASLPGVTADNINVSVTGDVLTIKGEVKAEQTIEEADYHVRERQFGSFSRSLALPTAVLADKAEAKIEDGILTLTLPKAEEVKPKTITVKPKK